MSNGIEQRASVLNYGEYEPLLTRAGELYPEIFGERELRMYGELFANNSVISPERLASIQPEYGLFHPREDIHPLIYSREGRDLTPAGSKQSLVAFLGPSSGGKDSILDIVEANYEYARLITTTTRPPRADERLEARYKYVTPQVFAEMIGKGEFAEFLPPEKQGKHPYGTTIRAVEQALQRELPLIIWRGDILGLPTMRFWTENTHREVAFLPAFVLPGLSLTELWQRQTIKRGVEQAIEWRFPKGLREIHTAAQLVDYLVVNPTDPSGEPRGAAAATLALFRYFESKLS